ncbi:MAG: NAD-dependent epimerase/dehydratase family protein [Nitrospirae bacterium]|nr:NAD-dependent epimerase/dehydratase family protein [Nitrospirota bacterium]
MGTLIITGSSGRIGSSFIDRIGESYTEVGLDRKGPPHPPPETEHVIDCDLSSDESVWSALDEVRLLGYKRIASVIHLAAYYSFSGEPSPLYEQVTLRGTQRLLQGLRDFEVEQFIFSSTMLVHAPCEPGERIDEDWPIKPKWDYPKSKVATEQLILRERGDVPVVFLRIAGVYNDHCHSIPIAQQIQRIYEQRFIGHIFSGDITHGAAFVHMEDMVQALVLAVEHRKDLPQVTTLLISEPDTLSYDELQRAISRELHGKEWKTYRIPKALAKFGSWLLNVLPGADPFIKPWMIDISDDHYALDISRARALLGWEPRHSLRDTLPKMLNFLKSDPAGWYQENDLMATPIPDGPPWPHIANVLLGLWLIGTAPALGMTVPALLWSDLASGAAIALFSLIATRHAWAAWAVCGVGLWVMSAPLLFWAANAAFYNNDLLIGALVVTFSVIVPQLSRDSPGSGAPPGWSYNPSGWVQRLGIVFLAMAGFFLSRYMAAFQLGHIVYPWDPFFGDSTRLVLTSDISKAFPVSDAGLGALSYLLDALAGLIGGRRRWRTMPWMVVLFGLFIIPPGVTSIVLVILQPVSIGAWCTLCLVASVMMLLMVSPALDEVIATGQFLLRTKREGGSIWRALWQGDDSAVEEPGPREKRSQLSEILHSIEAVSAPWNLWLSTLVGIGLMAAPTILHLVGAVADSTHIMGALVVTFSVVAFAEPVRLVRVLNILCGVWVLLATWILDDGTPVWPWISVVSGLALIALNLRRGPVENSYGEWQRFVR